MHIIFFNSLQLWAPTSKRNINIHFWSVSAAIHKSKKGLSCTSLKLSLRCTSSKRLDLRIFIELFQKLTNPSNFNKFCIPIFFQFQSWLQGSFESLKLSIADMIFLLCIAPVSDLSLHFSNRFRWFFLVVSEIWWQARNSAMIGSCAYFRHYSRLRNCLLLSKQAHGPAYSKLNYRKLTSMFDGNITKKWHFLDFIVEKNWLRVINQIENIWQNFVFG